MKLEYLVNNQKKMKQQKKFLEAQIQRNIKDMGVFMNKTELEIKKDQLISS